ncbi:histone-fold-containing protein [Lentinula aciculospora]|uniref:Histone-fold-containing protein n=1 Tax=Lentinula aciculospora TaxID=153920 RepID=A0A9W9DQ48_9AGAR|nr:histone-fold-containing protein [Lentinula aciculospora]
MSVTGHNSSVTLQIKRALKASPYEFMPPSQQQPYVRSGEHLNEFLPAFWQRQIDAAEQETSDYRHPILPLARIKKVMKSDPDVKMIAADAPILFCKACEIFIEEITARAFIIADSNKRRTLSRSDIAAALSKSDQFDFLIDIVPRDLQRGGAASNAGGPRKNAATSGITAGTESGAGVPSTQEVQSYRESDNSVAGKSEIVEQYPGNP